MAGSFVKSLEYFLTFCKFFIQNICVLIIRKYLSFNYQKIFVIQLSENICHSIIRKYLSFNYQKIFVFQLSENICHSIIRKYLSFNYQKIFVFQLSENICHSIIRKYLSFNYQKIFVFQLSEDVCLSIIRKYLCFNVRDDFSPDFENISFDSSKPKKGAKSKSILVGILYRPPDSSGFLKKLNVAISKAENFDNQEVFVLGDLNIDLRNSKKSNSNRIKRYKEFCSLHGLVQLIQEPKRITEKSETLLDHIISISAQKVSQHGVLNLGVSDHQLIYCTRKSPEVKSFSHKYDKIRLMKHYRRELFLKKL